MSSKGMEEAIFIYSSNLRNLILCSLVKMKVKCPKTKESVDQGSACVCGSVTMLAAGGGRKGHSEQVGLQGVTYMWGPEELSQTHTEHSF